MIYSTFSAENAPCKGCSERHVKCHAECEKYKAWHEDFEAKKGHEKQENSYQDYKRDRCTEYNHRLWKGDRSYKRHFKGKPIKK